MTLNNVDQYQIALGVMRQEAIVARGAIEAASVDFGVQITREVLAFVGALKLTDDQILEYWQRWHNEEAQEAPKLPPPAMWRVRMWFARDAATLAPSLTEYAARLAWLNIIL